MNVKGVFIVRYDEEEEEESLEEEKTCICVCRRQFFFFFLLSGVAQSVYRSFLSIADPLPLCAPKTTYSGLCATRFVPCAGCEIR